MVSKLGRLEALVWYLSMILDIKLLKQVRLVIFNSS